MLKLAVNLSMIFTEVPLLQRFALAKAQGFGTVEIQFPYVHSIDEIAAALSQHQLQLCLINVPAGDLMQGGCGLAGVPGCEAEFAAAIEQAIAYASQLQVPTVNILVGKQPEGIAYADCLDTLTQNLRLACDRLAAHNIQPVIEMINGINMPGFLIQRMAQAQDLLTRVQRPNLKLQYDCYHMAMMGEDVIQCFQNNRQHIAHIQFADCPGRHEPDTAELNFTAFFQAIAQSGYTGFVAAEYVPSQSSLQSLQWKQRYFPSETM